MKPEMTAGTAQRIQLATGSCDYWEYGDGATTLLLVHGFRGDHHGLEAIAHELLAIETQHPQLGGLRLIIPDLPGFGSSEPLPSTHDLAAYGSWLKSFADQVQAPLVVAHSFGTLVTAAALSAGYQPQHVTLINPISAPALQGPRSVLTKIALGYYQLGRALPESLAQPLLSHRLVVRAMSEIMTKTREPQLRRWIHAQHDNYFSNYANRQMLLEAFTASISNTVAAHAAAFTMPTAVIAGDRDDITPLVKQLELTQLLPAARLYPIRAVGHLVHYEAARETAEIIWRELLPLRQAQYN